MEVKGSSCGLTERIRHLEYASNKPRPCETLPIQHGWRFRQAEKGDHEWLPVSQFPTNVHLDLIHNHLIPDPFIAKNEKDVQWVGETSWVYKTTFQSPEYSDGEKAVLIFAGLDTYATVSLNGREILRTENMFIPESVDVTRDLRKLTDNDLEIKFDSTYLIGKKLVEKNADHQYGCWNGDPSRLAVRKAQYHYVTDHKTLYKPTDANLSRDGTGDLRS